MSQLVWKAGHDEHGCQTDDILEATLGLATLLVYKCAAGWSWAIYLNNHAVGQECGYVRGDDANLRESAKAEALASFKKILREMTPDGES